MAVDSNGKGEELVLRVLLLGTNDMFANLKPGKLSLHIENRGRTNMLASEQKAEIDAFLQSIHLHRDSCSR